MKNLKVAFYVSRYKDEDIQTPPSLQYLSGYLLEKQIIEEDTLIFADSLEDIIAFQPHVLCIGSVSQTFFDAKYISKKVKEAFPDCFSIIGGYHISALPKELSSEFDVGVLGEGEVTLYELIQLYLKNQHNDFEKLQDINGLCYRHCHQLFITEKRALFKNIDEQPRPYRRPRTHQENNKFRTWKQVSTDHVNDENVVF